MVQNAWGQNLSQNGAMSILSNCPITSDQLYVLAFWHNPSQASPDIFASCTLNPAISVPSNIVGIQSAFSDSNYIHLLIENRNSTSYYEYVTNELLIPLKKDKLYELIYRISLADYSEYSMDRIGVLFTVNKPFYPTDSRINEMPQLSTPKGFVLADTANWVEIRDTFTAAGGERYLTIGQFYPNDSLQFTFLQNPVNAWASYYIDGVEVHEIPEPIDTPKAEPLLPNVFTPNNDGINDSYSITNLPSNSKFEVFNRWGNSVFYADWYANNWRGESLNGSALAEGVYLAILIWTNTSGEIEQKTQTIHLFR